MAQGMCFQDFDVRIVVLVGLVTCSWVAHTPYSGALVMTLMFQAWT